MKTVQARQNVLTRMPACADSYQPSLLEKKCSVFFSAPICVLNHLLLVSSADNLFKQLGPRADPAKLSCENGAHVKSRMSLRCWRGKGFFYFLSAHSCFLLVPFFLQSSIQFCCNSCFSSVSSCENAHMSLRCSRGFFYTVFGSSCPTPKMNSYRMRHGEISYMQLNNAMFIYFKMCSICKFLTIIVENINIRFQSLVT